MHDCNCISLLCASHAVTQRQIEGSKFLNRISPFLMRALLPAMYGKCLQWLCVSNAHAVNVVYQCNGNFLLSHAMLLCSRYVFIIVLRAHAVFRFLYHYVNPTCIACMFQWFHLYMFYVPVFTFLENGKCVHNSLNLRKHHLHAGTRLASVNNEESKL